MAEAGSDDDKIEGQGPTARPRRGRRIVVLSVLSVLLLLGVAVAWWIIGLANMFSGSPHRCETSSDDLVHAATFGNAADARAIVAKTGRVDGEDTSYTALYCAAKNGHTDIVNELVARGARPDPPADSHLVPLFVAARDGRGDAVEALLQAGADPNRTSETGPALLAAVAGRSASDNDLFFSDKHTSDFGEPPQEPLDAPKRVDAVRSLLRHGARPEAELKHPTPLFTACYTNQPRVVDALLEGGAKPSALSYVDASQLSRVVLGDTTGTTPLLHGTLPPPTAGFVFDPPSYRMPSIFAAAGQGHVDIVRRLLAAGADPNQESLGGYRPLHAAVLSNDAETIRALLDAGADPSIRTAVVPDPYTFAREQQKQRAIEILEPLNHAGG